MMGERPPLEAEVQKAGIARDPLYSELVRLREHGLQPRISEKLSLPELTQIADAVCPHEKGDVERIKCAMTKAAKRFGGGDYSLALELLWGLTDKTFSKSLVHRRNKAMPPLDVPSVDAYNRYRRKQTAEAFTAQLRELYEETRAAEAAPDPPLIVRKRSLAGFAVALMLLGVAYIVTSLAASGGSQSTVIPPSGTVIDATTGHAVKHVGSRTTPQFVQIGGGDIFQACNFTNPPCRYAKGSALLKAKVGDVIEFSITLHDPSNLQVPYMKLYVTTYGHTAEAHISWKAEHSIYRITDSAAVEFPASATAPDLTYIPGSTVLFDQKRRVLAHLPDGIVEGGIALTDVGAPASCSYCEREYERYVNFKVQVTNDGHL